MKTKNILLFNPVGKNAKVSVFFQNGRIGILTFKPL